MNMLGLQKFILIRKKLIDKIEIVEVEEIKLGKMNLGNKGGIQTIFKLGKTFLEVTNCHLAPGYGPQAIENRMEHFDELISIKNDYVFRNPIEYSFITGDTNFKVPVSKEEFLVNYRVNKNCWIDY